MWPKYQKKYIENTYIFRISCSNVTTTRRRQEENHAKKIYITTVMNVLNLFLKGVITQCALLEIRKKG